MILKSKSIEEMLPLLCWDNGCLISKYADITVPYEIYLPEIFASGAIDFERYHSTWVKAIRSLPDYTIVHKQDFFINKRFKLKGEKEGKTFLSQSSDNHFNGRQFLEHKCYLYITLTTKNGINTKSPMSILCRNRVIPVEQLDRKRQKEFLDSVYQFIHILRENGIESRRLERDELIGTPDKFGLIENYINLDFSTKSYLSDLHVSDKEFMVGDKYVSCFSIGELEKLPEKVYTHQRHEKFSSESSEFVIGYPSQIGLELGFSHIYNQYFFLDSNKDTLERIEKRGREQSSLSGISRENAINKEFNDAYLNEAVIYSRRSVRCAFNVLCWDTNYLMLQKKNTIIGARLTNMDCTVSKTERIVPQIFWAGIAGGASQYPAEMTFLSFLEQGCCFINNETNYRDSKTSFGLRLCDRISGIPMHIDISDEPRDKGWIDNRNKIIIGPSGSGKSFWTNHMVRQYYEQGSHVVIVDVGDSYYGLCKLIQEETGGKDGVYYTYTEKHPIEFNPFYVQDGVYTVEKKEQLASLIFCLWKNESELITKAEETHIGTAINNYLVAVVEKKYRPCFDSFYAFLSKVFKPYLEQQGVRRENFDIDNLLQVLSPYAKGGMYDYLLNAKENINLLEKRFIVFEIDNIKDHKTLFPVVTLILMDTFISKMRHPSIAKDRKMILIEEAWKAISKSGTAEFIKYLYKTVRKHFGEAIVVTQEIEDIIGNEIIKNTIISNADCKILLDQRKYANKFEDIQKVLALTDKEKAIALSINKDIHTKNRPPYKEVFITLNGNHTAVYAVETSKEEYLTYTTEKKEKARLLELESKVGSMQEAIKEYIKIYYK